jgi:hypothetical protein
MKTLVLIQMLLLVLACAADELTPTAAARGNAAQIEAPR